MNFYRPFQRIPKTLGIEFGYETEYTRGNGVEESYARIGNDYNLER